MSRTFVIPLLTFAAGLLLGGAFTASAAPETPVVGPTVLASATGVATGAPDPPAPPGRRPSETIERAAAGRVIGIGGVFFEADDPAALRAWYAEHLGMEVGPNGWDFLWRERGEAGRPGRTVWNPFPRESDYFGPGEQQLMVNYIVDDLDALLERLRARGVEQVKPMEEYPYGRFAWVADGEGNRVELWEPPAAEPAAPSGSPEG